MGTLTVPLELTNDSSNVTMAHDVNVPQGKSSRKTNSITGAGLQSTYFSFHITVQYTSLKFLWGFSDSRVGKLNKIFT